MSHFMFHKRFGFKPLIADSQPSSPGEHCDNLLVAIEDALIMLVSPINRMLYHYRQVWANYLVKDDDGSYQRCSNPALLS